MSRCCLRECIATIRSLTTSDKTRSNRGELLDRAFQIHSETTTAGNDQDVFVANTLLTMYAKLGSLLDARLIFDRMPSHDVVLWNALLMGYAENGEESVCLELFARMSFEPNSRTFLAALKACTGLASRDEEDRRTASLARGMAVHSEASKRGLDSDIFVANTLVDMYSKCGSLADARRVFDRMERHNVVSWTALIMACSENKEEELALSLFSCMLRSSGCQPNSHTFVVAVNTCSGMAAREGRMKPGGAWKEFALEKGKESFLLAEKLGFGSDGYLVRAMVNLYVKAGSLVEARRLFERMRCKDVVSWTSLMLGYVENGEFDVALELFERKKSEGCVPDARVIVAALKACTGLAEQEVKTARADGKPVKIGSLRRGVEIVSQASALGYEADPYVACTTITMFSKCGSLSDSRRVFNKVTRKDTAVFTSLMMACVENGEPESALELFGRIIREEEPAEPNALTFVAAMSAVTSLSEREEGEETEAGKVVKPVSLARGAAVYSKAKALGCDKDVFVVSTAVDMFCKCGSLDHARTVYQRLEYPNLVSLNALILGYVENGEAEQALDLYTRANDSLPMLDARTYAAAVKACGSLVAEEAGKEIHGEFYRRGMELSSGTFGNSLLDFYARCGSMNESKLVFDSMPEPESVSWSSIIAGYSRQGESELVFKLVDEMVEAGVKPDGVTMVAVLTACSHAGLVEKGEAWFEAMSWRFGVSPEVEHYVCMVDMLGRANMLKEALEMVERMPNRANAMALKSLLGACRKWRNVEVGRVVFEALLRLKGGNIGSGFAVMRSLYASVPGIT